MEEILELELRKQELQALLIGTKDSAVKSIINDEIDELEEQIYSLKMEYVENVYFVENY